MKHSVKRTAKENVWSAWYLPTFDADKYVYHYTSFETAIKILYGDNLLFAPLSRTNDTTEQKSRIAYDFVSDDAFMKDKDKFERYWLNWTANSKVLCFSRDREKSAESLEGVKVRNKMEMSGRGFALPRMWAQYAETHSGVCLIFRKEELIDRVEKLNPDAMHDNIHYTEWYNRFNLSRVTFDSMMEIISRRNNTIHASELFKQYPEFANHLFFTKLLDWKGENEFRIVIPDTNDEVIEVDGVASLLAGVTVGERMPDSYGQVLRKLIPKGVDLSRMHFGIGGCEIERIIDLSPCEEP